MSKGSKRRPGKPGAYESGWGEINWGLRKPEGKRDVDMTWTAQIPPRSKDRLYLTYKANPEEKS